MLLIFELFHGTKLHSLNCNSAKFATLQGVLAARAQCMKMG
jgi:hypothetical protein